MLAAAAEVADWFRNPITRVMSRLDERVWVPGHGVHPLAGISGEWPG